MEIDHVGVVVADIQKSIEYYATHFGLALIGTVCEDPIQKVRIAFVGSPGQGVTLELLEPADDRSPVANALRKGGGLNHICYRVGDIHEALRKAKDQGHRVISGPVPAVAFGNQPVAFLVTRRGEIVEFVEQAENQPE